MLGEQHYKMQEYMVWEEMKVASLYTDTLFKLCLITELENHSIQLNMAVRRFNIR